MANYPKDKNVPFQRFCEWAKLYGDIVYAPLPGMDIVILNSYDVAQEILSKRPASTGWRKTPYLVSKLMGYGWLVLFNQPGISHSNQRRIIRKAIGPQRVKSYDSFIELEVAKLMIELERLQGEPSLTIRDAIGRLIIKVTYGDKIWEEMGRQLAHWNLEGTEIASGAFFGFWAVNILPALRFIPDWVPGLRFKQLSRIARIGAEKVRFAAYTRVLELYKKGTLENCILQDLLEEFGDDEDVRDATSSLYFAAFETTTAAVVQFLHAIFLYPGVAQRVFEEIQQNTQGERLPTMADRLSLPYTEAVLKESIRQNPFIPLGIVHTNEQEEIVRGCLIPKGSIIHQNNQFMLNDPKLWGDPEVFRPERFLEADASNKPNPLMVLFGWGIRVCPGMYFADRVLFHMVVTIVSLFHVVPLEGKKVPDPLTIEYSDLGIRQPIGFECRFVPRNQKARQLLKAISLAD